MVATRLKETCFQWLKRKEKIQGKSSLHLTKKAIKWHHPLTFISTQTGRSLELRLFLPSQQTGKPVKASLNKFTMSVWQEAGMALFLDFFCLLLPRHMSTLDISSVYLYPEHFRGWFVYIIMVNASLIVLTGNHMSTITRNKCSLLTGSGKKQ